MRKFTIIAIAIVSCGMLSSCFKDDALSAECDITQAWVHSNDVPSMFFNATDTLVNVTSTDSVITFNVRNMADLTAVAPMFNITGGATISPASGSAQDFSSAGVAYTVTSQDGDWHRRYNVVFKKVTQTVSDTMAYDFENYELDAKLHKYYVWHNEQEDGTFGNFWASGNDGFSITAGSATPDAYPTAPVTDGYDGAAVCLTTRSTGFLGTLVKKPIAAGNLFLGTFDRTQALTNTLACTQFGIPFDKKPVKVTGYYKYTPADKFTDANGNVLAKTDSADIYAVLYKNHDDKGVSITLDGSNIKTSSLIVGMASMKYVQPTDDWMEFEITFNYSGDIDQELLDNRGYNLTVVFSSSKSGAAFLGAIGSQLMIDKVRVISTDEEE